ncbi:MAG: hypothetical protein M3114_00365 [Thermoproteota archaeon]|nr:hypothetical protein [Thermoproteota archaeon]
MSSTSTTTTAMPYTTITESDLSKSNNNNNNRYFVLCNSCFWCASYLRHIGTLRCPSCKTQIIEFMPIKSDEMVSISNVRLTNSCHNISV